MSGNNGQKLTSAGNNVPVLGVGVRTDVAPQPLRDVLLMSQDLGLFPDEVIRMLAAPQGFEPRYADPESAVLPLNEGATFSN